MVQIVINKYNLNTLLEYGALQYNLLGMKLDMTRQDIKEVLENVLEDFEKENKSEKNIKGTDDRVTYEELLILLLNIDLEKSEKARMYSKLSKILDKKCGVK